MRAKQGAKPQTICVFFFISIHVKANKIVKNPPNRRCRQKPHSTEEEQEAKQKKLLSYSTKIYNVSTEHLRASTITGNNK